MPSILAWDRSFLDHWFSTSSYAGNVVFIRLVSSPKLLNRSSGLEQAMGAG